MLYTYLAARAIHIEEGGSLVIVLQWELILVALGSIPINYNFSFFSNLSDTVKWTIIVTWGPINPLISIHCMVKLELFLAKITKLLLILMEIKGTWSKKTADTDNETPLATCCLNFGFLGVEEMIV